jgi:hypothetical protein
MNQSRPKARLFQAKPVPLTADEPGKISADVQSTKLKQLLGKIKTV